MKTQKNIIMPGTLSGKAGKSHFTKTNKNSGDHFLDTSKDKLSLSSNSLLNYIIKDGSTGKVYVLSDNANNCIQTLHLIYVFDFDNIQAYYIDIILDRLREINSFTSENGMKFQITPVDAKQFSAGELEKYINNMNVQENDILWFYYSAPDYNKNDNGDDVFTNDDLYFTLKSTDARLSLMFYENLCWDKKLHKKTEKSNNSEIFKQNLQKLLLNTNGFVFASASFENETAYCLNDSGGLWSHVFWNQISNCKYENWNFLLDDVAEKICDDTQDCNYKQEPDFFTDEEPVLVFNNYN